MNIVVLSSLFFAHPSVISPKWDRTHSAPFINNLTFLFQVCCGLCVAVCTWLCYNNLLMWQTLVHVLMKMNTHYNLWLFLLYRLNIIWFDGYLKSLWHKEILAVTYIVATTNYKTIRLYTTKTQWFVPYEELELIPFSASILTDMVRCLISAWTLSEIFG